MTDKGLEVFKSVSKEDTDIETKVNPRATNMASKISNDENLLRLDDLNTTKTTSSELKKNEYFGGSGAAALTSLAHMPDQYPDILHMVSTCVLRIMCM